MKRRNFLALSGLVGATFGSGVLSAANLTFPVRAWHFLPEFDSAMVEHLDQLESEMVDNLRETPGHERLVRRFVNPVRIVQHRNEVNDYYSLFQNEVGSYVEIRKKGKESQTRFLNQLPRES